MKRVDREERMHRIRVGLTGLAVVFLVVLLLTAIGRSGGDRTSIGVQNELAAPDEPAEPLAEIGAAPGMPENETSEEQSAPKKAP